MLKRFRLKVVSATVLAFAVMLGAALVAYANPEPPSGAEQVVGPPLEAVFTGSFSSGVATFTVAGSCKKIPVAFGPFPIQMTSAAFANMTADNIEDLRFRGVGPAGCFSPNGGEDLIVTGVTKFNNTATVLGADISISVVKPK